MKRRAWTALYLVLIASTACDPTDDGEEADADGGFECDTGTGSDTEEWCQDMFCDWVGMPCAFPEDGDSDPCVGITGCPIAFCFGFEGAPGGFCTMGCQPATADDPEDGCGMLGMDVVCMDVAPFTADESDDAEGYGICTEQCVATPMGGDPGCTADYIRCDPYTWAWESQFATCLLPKCMTDADCLTPSGPECAGDGDCSAENGETCSDDGYCVFEAVCDTVSGRCNWEGDEDAEIGDPCASSWDCGDNGVCFPDDGSTDDYDKHYMRNGYCSRAGCKAANGSAVNGSGSADPTIAAEFGCGSGGKCHPGYDHGGLCLKSCDNGPEPADCRRSAWDGDAGVLDQNGDYECYDSADYGYPIWISDGALSYPLPNAYCSWVGSVGVEPPMSASATLDGRQMYKCGDGEHELGPADCSDLYASSGDDTYSMTCRNPLTGEEDTDGYCLDETTSGPTESW